MSTTANEFKGQWRITNADQWDHDYFVNLGVPAQISFRSDGGGKFRCGVVQGSIDGRSGMRNGKLAVEFSWDGTDEDREVGGRGWAEIEEDGSMKGHLFVHKGGDSGFTAERSRKKSKQPARSRR